MILDDSKSIQKLDSSNMRVILVEFHLQLQDAREIGLNKSNSSKLSQIQNIVWIGMGGSAIGGDVIRNYVSSSINIPIFINRNYTIPAFIDDKSLAIVSSYSGNTEETLSAYQAAVSQRAKILCITTGGKLAALAQRNDHQLITIPTGYPPRTALGYLTIPVLFFLQQAGLIANQNKAIDELVALIKKYADAYKPETAYEDNEAKKIAVRLKDKLPIIYSATEGMEAVSMRWQSQLFENSKVFVHCNFFPEMNHNEIVGWSPYNAARDNSQVVLLRDSKDHPRIQLRMDITGKLIEGSSSCSPIEISSQGESLLVRIFSLIYLGDWVSFYLAMLNGVDPTPIENISYLKKSLNDIE